MTFAKYRQQVKVREQRAGAIAKAGSLDAALAQGAISRKADLTLSEAIVLGLLRQEVRIVISVLGHGSTEIGEVLRVYGKAGLIKTYGVRNEIEASHAAVALRWVTGEKAAVLTSIGPGALQALSASIVGVSDGIGVWYLFGDETTQDEGLNMQQIPKSQQNLFLNLCQTMGQGYCLHTPEAIGTALRRGLNTVDHPSRPGPFYLLMPMNTQCSVIKRFNLDELPVGIPPAVGAAGQGYQEAVKGLAKASRVVVKVGGGARSAGTEIEEFLRLVDGMAVLSPLVSGVIPYENPRNMTVGGSKGTLCGNYAMEEADLLVVLGSRAVCQSDCSRTGYPNVKHVININTDIEACLHYNKTAALLGEVKSTLHKLNQELKKQKINKSIANSAWFKKCLKKKKEWEAFKADRYKKEMLHDDKWGGPVLTQPAVIKAVTDWAKKKEVKTFFDAGDVQANGFQIVEDERLGRTFTETGASYMGFGVSALLATGIAKKGFYGLALTGDGSFTMNPQVLIDGVQHGARGCIVLLDNRRMGAISGLQVAQFGVDYASNDEVAVDYSVWAGAVKGIKTFSSIKSMETLVIALNQARDYEGLSLIHVPVYFGPDPLGGMGVFGRWNVGPWCDEVQRLRHEIGL
jgi:3D-(3,5/4)-trihydroxycyclohexane-1,2-dione acylhydrolase (decyclizing)